MIKGIDKLSADQTKIMYKVNEHHTQCVGLDYKAGMKIVETWINEDGCVCVRLKNGEWYHYTTNGDWY